MKLPLLLASLFVTSLPALAQGRVEPLVKELVSAGDNADADRIDELAEIRTPEALAGLAEVYEAMQSVYMRRAVLRGLTLYEDLDGMSGQALEHIMDAATLSSERELREIAVDELARCRTNGRSFLRLIVDAPTEDHVRELAMEHLAGDPRRDEEAWFRGHYLPKREEEGGSKKKRKKRKDDEPEERKVRRPTELREMAFEAVVRWLSDSELVNAIGDRNPFIRTRALEELDGRDHASVLQTAERLYERAGVLAELRLRGARILARHLGAEAVPRFLDDGGRRDWPEELILGLADIVASYDDPASEKLILKKVGRGKDRELMFSVLAARNIDDAKVDKALVKMLKNRNQRARTLAARLLAEREYEGAQEGIEKALAKAKTALESTAYFEALGVLRKGEDEWHDELVAKTASEETVLRNAAIEALGAEKSSSNLELLSGLLAHSDWSTRLAAARALAELGNKEAVGALCLRVAEEEGRLAVAFGELLFELTGKPYGAKGRSWKGWWEKEGQDFRPITAKELREARRKEEARRLKEITRGSFFGIKIDSSRVIFIVDVSGSMEERTRGRYIDEKGVTRMKKAQEELAKAIGSLEPNARFNLVVFSGSAEAWSEESRPLTTESRAEAEDYVRRLRAGGGTNLYDALRLAFDDADVDTIFVISDGEPSVGDVTDPLAIRDQVAEWNRHRNIVIHSIAVGGRFRVLEWLAKDSGGNYVKFP